MYVEMLSCCNKRSTSASDIVSGHGWRYDWSPTCFDNTVSNIVDTVRADVVLAEAYHVIAQPLLAKMLDDFRAPSSDIPHVDIDDFRGFVATLDWGCARGARSTQAF